MARVGITGLPVSEDADLTTLATPPAAGLLESTGSAYVSTPLGTGGRAVVAEAAAVIDPASPYTVAAGVREIVTGSALTVNLPSSGVVVGESVRVTNSAAAAIVVTFARSASDTIDATTSVAVTLAAHAKCAAVRRASADWRSVQPVAAGGDVATNHGAATEIILLETYTKPASEPTNYAGATVA